MQKMYLGDDDFSFSPRGAHAGDDKFTMKVDWSFHLFLISPPRLLINKDIQYCPKKKDV